MYVQGRLGAAGRGWVQEWLGCRKGTGGKRAEEGGECNRISLYNYFILIVSTLELNV